MRTKLPRVLAALAAACLLMQAPAVASTDDDLRHKRQQLNDRIDAARDDLAETKHERRDTRAQLQRIDGRQTRLAAQLAKLTADLDSAEGRLREAEQALRRTQVEIDANRDELAVTRRDLSEREDLLRARARASYMHGGVNYAEAVLDIDTANELGTSLQYMRTMITEDTDKVEEISTLKREFEAMIARLADLEAAQDDARAQREAERDKVARLVAGKREVEAQLAAQEKEHEALLATLDSDAEGYRAAIDDMESESRSIAARLAELAGSGGGGAVSTRRSASGFQWPVNAPITSGFGYRMHPVLGYARLHTGIDFGAGIGTPIVAAAGGVVVSAGWTGGYGNAVIISHGGGIATLYGHQSRLAVGTGAHVSRGQVIGYVGTTGLSTGPHLHFEVRVNGTPVDPRGYL